jgi:EAL domain-containing protein (putative c-di-GMP-specific phosphodiesterase class I)/GAF domain-containing protein
MSHASFPIPPDETERLAELRDLDILDTEPEEALDALTRLAAFICGTPIALVSLVDADRQWFKSRVGLEARETSRDIAFCAHVVADSEQVLVVPDAREDARFRNNPLVTGDANIRFYAGAPLKTGATSPIGTLCVIDRVPRELTAAQREALETLSRAVVAQLELRRRLSRATGYLDAFARYLPSPLWVKDEAGGYVIRNAAHRGLFNAQVQGLHGQTDGGFFGSEAADAMRATDQEVIATGRPLKETVMTHGGSRHWLVHKFPLRIADAHFVGGTATEITEEVKRQHALARHDRFYTLLSQVTATVARAGDADALCLEVCRLVVRMGGLRTATVVRLEPASGALRTVARAESEDAQGLEHADAEEAPLDEIDWLREALAAGGGTVSNDVAVDPRIQRGGEMQALGHVACAAIPLMVDGSAWGAVFMAAAKKDFFDAFYMARANELAGELAFGLDRLRKTADLHYLSFHDVVTGLPNAAFLESTFRTAASESTHGCLLLTEISRLDEILAADGPSAVDGVLRQATQRLKASVQNDALIGSIRKGVFAVFLPGVTPANSAQLAAQRPDLALAPAYGIGDQQIGCPAYTGAAFFPENGDTFAALLAAAERALQRSRNRDVPLQFYDEKLGRKAAEYVRLEGELRKAIERGEFVNFYQPKVNIASRKIVGAEALMRWRHPQRGLVAPAEFVPALESSGLILEAGRQVLDRSLADWNGWRKAGLDAPRIAVNITSAQVQSGTLIEDIQAALTAHGCGPEALGMELTESGLMTEGQRAIEVLQALKKLGIPIALDDFGTGYSSLAYLVTLPIDILKIDRAFVMKMDKDPAYMGLANTIISLAHSLNFRVVAEGVEREEQANLLRLLRCEEAQGYLYSKPLPAEEFAGLLARRDPRPS